MNITTFKELNLHSDIDKALDDFGLTTPTEIQSKVIPLIRDGIDVIGRSQTGTGKTLAFGIPAIENILNSDDIKSLAQILIICPTRELSQQVGDEIKKLTKYTRNIKTAEIYGGAPMGRQITQLKTANIVIGTPGRIMDHMRRRTLKLSNLKMVVLDEADEMLSMGFKEDIETILIDAPEERQTVLFSATMPKPILELTSKIQNSPVLIEVQNAQVALDNIKQIYVDVPMGRKTDALALILKYYSPNKAILFCNTKKFVDEITAKLVDFGFNAQGLHGDMKQSQRTQVLESFKRDYVNILVATDVAARGIDVKDVDYVINYDIPQNNEYYVHRIGRTGRAGKEGTAITICSGRRQTTILKQILRETNSNANEVKVPTLDKIKAKCYEEEIFKINNILEEEPEDAYNEIVDKILSKNISLYKLASNLIKLQLDKSMSGFDKFENLDEFNNKVIATDSQKGFKKIIFNIGRSCRIAPNHIVGAIAETMDIPGYIIGKIEIYDDHATVEIPESIAEETAEKMSGTKIAGKFVRAEVIQNKSKCKSSKNTKSRAENNHSSKSKDRRRKDHRKFDDKQYGGRSSNKGGKSSSNGNFKRKSKNKK